MMQNREDIFTHSVEHLKNQGSIKDLVSSLSDLDWLNTLEAQKINEIIVRLTCICDDNDTLNTFVDLVQKTNVKPEPLSDEQWITIFKHAKSFLMKRMISGYKYLTTGSNPRDPESKEEEILYCLSTCIRGWEKMPSEIVTNFLTLVDLNIRTPDYDQDALCIACESGNIDYIRIILQRAVSEKNRTDLIKYIQDRYWIWNRDKCTIKFLEDLENIFHQLDLPFFEAVHGRFYNKNNDILSNCDKTQMLEICIKYLPNKSLSYILQHRAFTILCNFINGELEELRKAIEIFEREGVVLSKVFEKRCKGKGMCLLDKICLEGNQAEGISYILSKMTDDEKKRALTCKNYGFRTPLAHAKYYSYKSTAKEDVITAEMTRLGLKIF